MMNYETARKFVKGDRVRLNIPKEEFAYFENFLKEHGLENGKLYELERIMDVSNVPEPFVTFSIKSNGKVVPSLGQRLFDGV